MSDHAIACDGAWAVSAMLRVHLKVDSRYGDTQELHVVYVVRVHRNTKLLGDGRF